jgi:hypothetical protein
MHRRSILAAALAIVALLMLGGATAQAAPGSLRVLLVETQGASEFISFTAALRAEPGVSVVDEVDASTFTPSQATLASYDLIAETGDSSYQDPALYGNRLADYIDAGGAVIQFAYDNWENDGAHPTGRFESGGYPPFIPGPNDNNATTLGMLLVPTSPLLAGVPSFSTGLNTTDQLAPGATLLARFTDGRNAIATKGRVVSVTAATGYESDPDPIQPVSAAARLTLNAGNVLGRHAVTVKKKGSGSGTVTSTPAGIKCGKTCTTVIASGTAITLKAKAKKKNKSAFSRWKGVPGCKKKAKCTFTPTANTTVKAKFRKQG